MTPVTDPAMTRVHRMVVWGSLDVQVDYDGSICRIVPGGDTQCDPPSVLGRARGIGRTAEMQPTVNPYAEERAREELHARITETAMGDS